LRDVGEDARVLDRVYIPTDLLKKYELEKSDLRANQTSASYPLLVEELMELAERHYLSGLESVKDLDFRVRPGIRSAAKMYREILNEIRKNGYDNLTKRAFTKKSTKLRLSVIDTYEQTKNRYKLKSE